VTSVVIKPVLFQEGAPLDPNELNKLYDNINQVYQLANQIQNATVNQGQTVKRLPVIDSGRLLVEGGLKAKEPKLVDININSSLFSEFLTSKENYPIITASVSGGDGTSKKHIGVTVVHSASPKIYLYADTAVTFDFYVNWIAVAFKAL